MTLININNTTKYFAVTILDELAQASCVHVVNISRHIAITRPGLDGPLTVALRQVIFIGFECSIIGFFQSLVKAPSISLGSVWM